MKGSFTFRNVKNEKKTKLFFSKPVHLATDIKRCYFHKKLKLLGMNSKMQKKGIKKVL